MLFFKANILLGQQSICLGAIKYYDVDADENLGNGTLGSTYSWSVLETSFVGSITKSTASGNKIQIDWKTTAVGTYSLFVKEVNASGCTAEKKLLVTITNLIVNIQNQYVCLNETNQWVNSVVFNTNLDEKQFTFKWYKNNVLLPNTSSFLTVNELGKYKVAVSNNQTACNAESNEAIVFEVPKIQTNVTVNNDFQDIQQIVIQATGGIPPYSYSIDGGNYQLNNIFTVNRDGVYEISVKDLSDCNNTNVKAYVLKYPKYFTPNGDGYNDTWYIEFPSSITTFKTSIFDRFGKLIHQLNTKEDSWSGTYNGNNLPATDYWFVTDYIDNYNNKRQFKAHFSLKR